MWKVGNSPEIIAVFREWVENSLPFTDMSARGGWGEGMRDIGTMNVHLASRTLMKRLRETELCFTYLICFLAESMGYNFNIKSLF